MKKAIQTKDNVFKKAFLPDSKKVCSVLFLFTLLLLCGCSSGYENYAEANLKLADSVSSAITSSAAKIGRGDSNHTFIRTADIKFKVQNVKTATFRIEDIVSKHGGYVTYTNLSSNISYVNSTKVKEDSLMETTHYKVENSLTIRVPNTHLDSTLREIAPLMDFLDHRTIKADDIKFTLMSNQLAENRYKHHKVRFTEAIDKKGKKLEETADAEHSLLFKQENADNTRIETLDLLDQVSYSTITLYIYQPETIKYSMLPCEDNIKPYQPSFLKRVGESFSDGWYIFEQIILFFVQMWGLVVLMIALFFLIRWMVGYLSKSGLKKA
jgi:hypothetical protein